MLVGVAVAARIIKFILQLAEQFSLIAGRDKTPRLAAPNFLLSILPVLDAFLLFFLYSTNFASVVRQFLSWRTASSGNGAVDE